MVNEGPVLRLATRASPLARWQADRVGQLLARVGVGTVQVVVETTGDRRLDIPLDRLGGVGVFVKEVQAAVVRGQADVAVHSAKDLPAAPELAAPGLVLAAVPERGDARDVLVGATLATLATGATVATGSARRRVQLANLRPDLTFTGLRGNLATRLAAVGAGPVGAVVVAKAAIDRLAWVPPDGMETEVLPELLMLPQVGQGALAVECRADDDVTRGALAVIDDPRSARLVEAERAFLAELGGGCTLPVGAHATWVGDLPAHGGGDQAALPGAAGGSLELTGMLASSDGVVVLRHTDRGTDPVTLGRVVARHLLDGAGGRQLGEWTPLGTPTPTLGASGWAG
jgi:hydroxymethylbilane synthase